MTGMEVLVVIVFLLLGYWIVSAAWDKFVSPPEALEQSNRASSPRPGGTEGESRADTASTLEDEDISATWFRVLEVPSDASQEQIALAYRRMIAQYHPDKVAQLGTELRSLAELKSKQINAAYDYAMKGRR